MQINVHRVEHVSISEIDELQTQDGRKFFCVVITIHSKYGRETVHLFSDTKEALTL